MSISRWVYSLFAAVMFLFVPSPIHAQIVSGQVIYDNAAHPITNALGVIQYFPSPYEVADEIFLAPNTSRLMNDFQFGYYGDFVQPTNGSFATGILRLYKMDGPKVSGATMPGTVLYESVPFPVFPGYFSALVSGIKVTVPDTLAWSVKFGGILDGTVSNRAGLLLYSPPVVGTTFNDFWINDPSHGGWSLRQIQNNLTGEVIPGSFDAKISAVVDTTVKFETPIRLSNGAYQLRATGPAGRSILVSATSDLKSWTPIVRLKFGVGGISYLDQNASQFPVRYYRTQLIFDEDIRVQNVQVSTNGLRSLEAVGPFGLNFAIQASADLKTWQQVFTNTYTSTPTTFVDTNAPTNKIRFYRTVLLPGK